MTNLCARKVLCHHAEVAKAFQCATTDHISCNVISGWKIIPRKQSMLTKLKELAERHQTHSSQVGSGYKTSLGMRLAWEQGWYNPMIQIRRNSLGID